MPSWIIEVYGSQPEYSRGEHSWAGRPTQGNEKPGPHSPSSATNLPFVIPTGAKRSGGIRGSFRSTECAFRQSAAQWRDLQYSAGLLGTYAPSKDMGWPCRSKPIAAALFASPGEKRVSVQIATKLIPTCHPLVSPASRVTQKSQNPPLMSDPGTIYSAGRRFRHRQRFSRPSPWSAVAASCGLNASEGQGYLCR